MITMIEPLGLLFIIAYWGVLGITRTEVFICPGGILRGFSSEDQAFRDVFDVTEDYRMVLFDLQENFLSGIRTSYFTLFRGNTRKQPNERRGTSEILHLLVVKQFQFLCLICIPRKRPSYRKSLYPCWNSV